MQAMILINMLITIVTNMFQEVKEDVGKRANDFEVLEMMLIRVGVFGFPSRCRNVESGE